MGVVVRDRTNRAEDEKGDDSGAREIRHRLLDVVRTGLGYSASVVKSGIFWTGSGYNADYPVARMIISDASARPDRRNSHKVTATAISRYMFPRSTAL